MASLEEQLSQRFGSSYHQQDPLSRYTTLHLGGPARHVVLVHTVQDVLDLFAITRVANVPCAILGGGSNTLASDAGYSGVVMIMRLMDWRIEGSEVFAEAGVFSSLLARQSAQRGLGGFSWAVSLPGTLGGAVRGNAGCFGGEMKDTVTSVCAIRPSGEMVTYTRDECQFAYRESRWKHEESRGEVIVSLMMQLRESSKEEEMNILASCLERRKTSQPLGTSSAGCMFKNWEYANLPEVLRDIPQNFLEKRVIPAGWIIEQLGMKGFSCGGAQISPVHGNFLMNHEGASAKDILRVVQEVQKRAMDVYGITLEPEVSYLGEGFGE